jgi:endonuclease G
MNHNIRTSLMVGSLLVALLSGCTTPPHAAFRNAIRTEYGKQAGYAPDEKRWISDNCPLGMPKHKAGVDFGCTRTLVRRGYVLEYSAADKIPLWVCERVTSQQVTGPLRRPKPEPFAPDPKLEKGRRAELSDYKRSGFDRGHQEPSADQTVDATLQKETYYLSNMCPQYGELNQKIWQKLEDQVRKLAVNSGTVYVVTGPMFYEEAEDDPKRADGYVEHQVIGDGVAVPTHFFKMVFWKDYQGKWQGTAFVMANQKDAFPKPYDFAKYIRPIRWIEERTGLDFDPELPGPDVIRVEEQPGHMWN